jgi:hypothetical protein
MAGCGGDETHADRALEYLARTSAAMATGYVADCVTHACVLAELLLQSQQEPWIARLHVTIPTDAGIFHVPLTPKRFTAVTWNTHYVCCVDHAVYDPMVPKPIPIDKYCGEVFGLDATLAPHLSPQRTAELWRAGALRTAFRPTR